MAEKNQPVRMDDGADLIADVYYPADPTTGARAAGRFPVLLTQTPYSGSLDATNLASANGPGAYFVQRGYIFVSADVRGSGRSLDGQGRFFSARDAQDGVDLVRWVAHLPGSNGVVGLQGCSYLGQTQLYTAARLGRLYGKHQPVKAMIPGCIGGDVYRDIYSDNGIATPAWVGAGLAGGSELGPTTEKYLLAEYLESERGGGTAYDRAFWLQRDHVRAAREVVRAGIPALLWDGWEDNGFGGLELYAALQNAAFGRGEYRPVRPGERVTGRYQAITGEWHHGGGLDFGIELQWYDTWLKHEDTGLPTRTTTPLHIWDANRGWVDTAAYPMTDRYTRRYLDPPGRLSRRPVDSGAFVALRWGLPSQAGTVATFATAPFRRGATLAGPSAVKVVAHSSTRNLELMADLYDVAPGGTRTQISHGGLLGSLRTLDRGRSWRDRHGLPMRPFLSLTRDVPVPVGPAVVYSIPLQPTVWTLRPGHRLQLQLSTEADPRLCVTKLAQVEAPALGCAPRPAALAALAGGSYTIDLAGRTFVSLPLMRRDALRKVRSGITPTSHGVALPLDWGRPSS
jgi:predicted acyl esterase